MRNIVFLSIASLIIALASCKQVADTKTSTIVNRDPNGTSELQLTMREMYDHFEQIKQAVVDGKELEEIRVFDHILTDRPTEAGKNTTDLYKAMAASYFHAVDQLKAEQDQASFELIVDTCINCHRQVCPGPTVKIKKLYL